MILYNHHTIIIIGSSSHHHQSLARDPGTLSKLTVLPCGGLGVDSDTYWNELHTSRLIMKDESDCNVMMTMTMMMAILACIYINDVIMPEITENHSAAKSAVGSVVELTDKIASGQVYIHHQTSTAA